MVLPNTILESYHVELNKIPKRVERDLFQKGIKADNFGRWMGHGGRNSIHPTLPGNSLQPCGSIDIDGADLRCPICFGDFV